MQWTDEDGHVCHLRRHHKVIGNQSAAVISTESVADRDSTFRCEALPSFKQWIVFVDTKHSDEKRLPLTAC